MLKEKILGLFKDICRKKTCEYVGEVKWCNECILCNQSTESLLKLVEEEKRNLLIVAEHTHEVNSIMGCKLIEKDAEIERLKKESLAYSSEIEEDKCALCSRDIPLQDYQQLQKENAELKDKLELHDTIRLMAEEHKRLKGECDE